MIDNKMRVFYGTSDSKLIKEKEHPVSPTYNTGNIYEFGIGFYTTPDKDTGLQYAITKAIEAKVLNENLNIKDTMDIVSEAYLHEFEVNLDIITNLGGKTIENGDVRGIRNQLIETINGYRNVNKCEGYSPNRHYTMGPLCGSYWDEEWKDKDISCLEESETNKFIDNCLENMSEQIQLCIHRISEGNDEKTKYLKGFTHISYEVIQL